MSRIDEIKDEIVSGTKYQSWDEYWTVLGITNNYAKMQQLSDELAKRYATECCQASLEEASGSLCGMFIDGTEVITVRDANKYCDSIKKPENIILL